MRLAEKSKSELDYGNFTDEEKRLITNAMNVFGEQGHSGGSAGFVIGSMRGLAEKLFQEHELVNGSYLFHITAEIRQLEDEELRYKLYKVLSKLMDYKPVSPLTGEDDEWFDYGDDTDLQNIRCSSVFKNKITGKAYDIDGRSFSHPSYSFCSWIGFTRGGCAPEVTFPYEPTKQYVHFADEDIGIFLPEKTDERALMNYFFQLRLAGFDPKHNIIDSNQLFLRGYECDEVKTFFDNEVKQKDLSDHYSFNFPDDYDAPTLNPLMIKAYRLRALLGYNFKETENDIFEVQGVKMKFEKQQVYIPSRHFQAWIPYLEENEPYFVWNLSYCGRDGKTNPDFFHIDRLKGHSDILVPIGGDTDDYLYRKRREFGLKHPNKKNKNISNTVLPVFEEGNDLAT